jgi:hypothetical protein
MALPNQLDVKTRIKKEVYPLVMTNIAIENDHLIIVDLPIENGDFP